MIALLWRPWSTAADQLQFLELDIIPDRGAARSTNSAASRDAHRARLIAIPGHVTSFECNARGQVTKATKANGVVTESTCSATGLWLERVVATKGGTAAVCNSARHSACARFDETKMRR